MNLPPNRLRTLALALASLLLALASQATNPRTMVAILDFEQQGTGFPNQDMGRIVVEWLTTSLVRSGRVDVVERSLLKKILEEQKLGLSGLVDRETAARIGDVLGAKVIISGSVIALGSKIEVNARLIKPNSASVLAAETVKGEGLENLERLVQEMAVKIVADFPMEGYVVSVEPDGAQCQVDLGREVGVQKGLLFDVYTEGREVRHPVTGEVLNIERNKIGTIQVVQVGARTSRCQIVSVEPGARIAYGQKIATAEAAATAPSPAPGPQAAPARPRPEAEAPRAAPPPQPLPAPAAAPPPPQAGWKFLAAWRTGFGGKTLGAPADVAVDPPSGTVFVLDYRHNAVECFDVVGAPLRRCGVKRGEPMGIAAGTEGSAWVAETDRNQITHYGPDGAVLGKFGDGGHDPGEMEAPSAVALDGEGNLYVAEAKNARVQKFSPDGRSLWIIGDRGPKLGRFVSPSGVAAEPSGTFYVVDKRLGSVEAFDANGAYLRTLAKGLSDPSAIHLGEGELFVAETGRNRIVVLDLEGNVKDSFSRRGREPGALNAPLAAVGLGSKVYVADTRNGRIQVFER